VVLYKKIKPANWTAGVRFCTPRQRNVVDVHNQTDALPSMGHAAFTQELHD
jgi:hypothetical protein